MDHPEPELNSVTRDSGEARQQLAKGRALYSRIVKIAGRFPRRGSDQVLGFCLAQAKLGTGKLIRGVTTHPLSWAKVRTKLGTPWSVNRRR